MNKNELVSAVAHDAGLSKTAATKAVDAVFDGITHALKRGEDVRLVGFGTFLCIERKATQGRNPRTGEKIKISAARLPKFRAGKGLKQEVSSKSK